jgi:urea carboxylase
MFGITPMPIFDPTQQTSYLREFMVFFRPGDIVMFKPVDRDGYDKAVEDVDAGRFSPPIREITFDLGEFSKDIDGYNARLEGMINGH